MQVSLLPTDSGVLLALARWHHRVKEDLDYIVHPDRAGLATSAARSRLVAGLLQLVRFARNLVAVGLMEHTGTCLVPLGVFGHQAAVVELILHESLLPCLAVVRREWSGAGGRFEDATLLGDFLDKGRLLFCGAALVRQEGQAWVLDAAAAQMAPQTVLALGSSITHEVVHQEQK